jgi:hypothetical protein
MKHFNEKSFANIERCHKANDGRVLSGVIIMRDVLDRRLLLLLVS